MMTTAEHVKAVTAIFDRKVAKARMEGVFIGLGAALVAAVAVLRLASN